MNTTTDQVNLNINSISTPSIKKEDDESSEFTVLQDIPVVHNINAQSLQVQDTQEIKSFTNRDDEFIKLVRSLSDLTDQQIRIIEVRYLSVLTDFKKRIKIFDFLYHFSRIFISLGGVAVPALLSIQSPGQITTSVGLYWFTWVISLAVTICHNISNIFRFDKKYQGIHATIEKLEKEGWQYLELSGRYSSHHIHVLSTHANQYLHFVNTIEKIKTKQMESEYSSPPEEKHKTQNISEVKKSTDSFN